MRSSREKWREARLLLIIDALTGSGKGAEAVDVFALDFLLQHPSLLLAFLQDSSLKLPPDVVPSVAETESSEEALLRWKRSVGGRILAPMIGRLVARGLVRRRTDGRFALEKRGEEVAKRLGRSAGDIEGERLPRLAGQVAMNPQAARQSLLAALAAGSG